MRRSVIRTCDQCGRDVDERLGQRPISTHIFVKDGMVCGRTARIGQVTETPALIIPADAWGVVAGYLQGLDRALTAHVEMEGVALEVRTPEGWDEVSAGLNRVLAIIDGTEDRA